MKVCVLYVIHAVVWLIRGVHSVSSEECASSDVLPPIQTFPTPQHPFVFIHIDKTGGSSIRHLVYESAVELELGRLIPPKDGLPNIVYRIPQEGEEFYDRVSNLSVVAGHFAWGVWTELPYWIGENQTRPPPCFIMGRHPVERNVNWLCREKGGPYYMKPLNSLSQIELEQFVESHRRGTILTDHSGILLHDEGVEDAACRFASGRRVTTGVVLAPGETLELPPRVDSATASIAMRNSEQCVIGILEEWESTKRVLKHWFPWMNMSHDKHIHRGVQNKETLHTLNVELREVIETHNTCDMQLYKHMRNRFDSQLAHLEKYQVPPTQLISEAPT